MRILLIYFMMMFSVLAHAETPLRIIVPSSAGNGVDSIARVIAYHISRSKVAYVENLPGANSKIGLTALKSASSDTIMIASSVVLSQDNLKDFTPVAYIADTPMYLTVSARYHTLQEFLNEARRGNMNFGALSGLKTTPGMYAAIQFQKKYHFTATFIPYRGNSEEVREIVAGRIDFAFITIPANTFNLQQFETESYPYWNGAWMAPGTSKEVVEKYNQILNKILNAEDFQLSMKQIGVTIDKTMTVDEFKIFVEQEIINAPK